MASGLMLDEEEFNLSLSESFSAEKLQGQTLVAREKFMQVLKQLPGFELTDRELTTIGAICKQDTDGE